MLVWTQTHSISGVCLYPKVKTTTFHHYQECEKYVYDTCSVVPPIQEIVLSLLFSKAPVVLLLEDPNEKHTVL